MYAEKNKFNRLPRPARSRIAGASVVPLEAASQQRCFLMRAPLCPDDLLLRLLGLPTCLSAQFTKIRHSPTRRLRARLARVARRSPISNSEAPGKQAVYSFLFSNHCSQLVF